MFLAEDISIPSEKLDYLYMCCLTVPNSTCRNSVISTLHEKHVQLALSLFKTMIKLPRGKNAAFLPQAMKSILGS